jgi:hypothetical protein
MTVCRATKANCEPCMAPAKGPHAYCWAHDPANAEQRSRMASKAARSKPSRELIRLKAQLVDLTHDVLAGEIETGRAAVANQLINTRLRAIGVERRVKEAEDLEVKPETLIKALFGHVMSGIEDLKARREKFDSEADKGLASEYAAAISETWQRYLEEARRLSG